MHNMTLYNAYLLIDFSGKVNFKDINRAAIEIHADPLLLSTNNLWNFYNCYFELNYIDLRNLSKDIQSAHDNTKRHKKTAVLAPLGLGLTYAELWAQMASHLPYRIRTFHEPNDAEQWLLEGIEQKYTQLLTN